MRSCFKIFLFIFFFLPLQKECTAGAGGLVKWISLEEAMTQYKNNPKPIIIDFYTNWCGWCKKMIQVTYSNPGIADYINTHFYPVAFNAETRDTIEYEGEEYINKGIGRRPTHELAIKLLNGRLSYPTTLLMNPNVEYSIMAPGYMDVKSIEPLLVYTVENIYRTTPYSKFAKYFKQALAVTQNDTSNVNWISLNEAVSFNKDKPKKTLINIYANWCNGCKTMNKTTYTHPVISNYVNNTFYAVDFDAETKEPVEFGDHIFTNDGADGTPFHSFVTAILKNNIILPTMIILDENSKLIGNVPYYLAPENIEPILKYYGDNAFKTSQWQDYQGQFVGEVKK